ncbi:hypothetical protein COT42_03050 [Candidatus Saganbacteria bacterium CG08_land_8_20_14_0_20_45_16]|uniref:Uncharacterized protein n=1 Tax=Candidatus Saganbacteria bacterium CG08_land_8_20_14_0_20_45_16 TaxID=2014293 RepID=A0A2H0XZC6_UNCSA|nr:MAG: hypothetical protein COT42_03050 [Candidatus Saganbacteria bacterium CG08_land_8_20_14_0_20_45_16]
MNHRFYGLLPQQAGRENQAAENPNRLSEAQAATVIRETNVDQGEIGDRRGDQIEAELDGEESPVPVTGDSLALSATVVALPNAVRPPAQPQPQTLREGLRQRMASLYEQAYSNCFHHNGLVARVAEWLMGNAVEQLARTGMGQEELAAIRDRVRLQLRAHVQTNLEQVVYDETVMDVCNL